MAILNPDQINDAFWGRKISYRDALSQMQALGRGAWDLGTNASELENYSPEEQAAIKSGGFLPPISAHSRKAILLPLASIGFPSLSIGMPSKVSFCQRAGHAVNPAARRAFTAVRQGPMLIADS